MNRSCLLLRIWAQSPEVGNSNSYHPSPHKGGGTLSAWSEAPARRSGAMGNANIVGPSAFPPWACSPCRTLLSSSTENRRRARTRRDGTGRVNPTQGFLVREQQQPNPGRHSGCTDSSPSSEGPAQSISPRESGRGLYSQDNLSALLRDDPGVPFSAPTIHSSSPVAGVHAPLGVGALSHSQWPTFTGQCYGGLDWTCCRPLPDIAPALPGS